MCVCLCIIVCARVRVCARDLESSFVFPFTYIHMFVHSYAIEVLGLQEIPCDTARICSDKNEVPCAMTSVLNLGKPDTHISAYSQLQRKCVRKTF
jgi:hypothetical protein